ncbi:hypothetical protein BCR34DRAFT_303130 [Clohesyomyces aquaticus]|uniref:Uncharacterized protein n=1 Tax=Clohesyomyces aquaticus TaxID=1231657 RepID=A0A1Y1ZQP6_9PLEO|nr:hypothetical protein BCR34DRAFT_303130 [Clohesyomyces aquaticus]
MGRDTRLRLRLQLRIGTALGGGRAGGIVRRGFGNTVGEAWRLGLRPPTVHGGRGQFGGEGASSPFWWAGSTRAGWAGAGVGAARAAGSCVQCSSFLCIGPPSDRRVGRQLLLVRTGGTNTAHCYRCSDECLFSVTARTGWEMKTSGGACIPMTARTPDRKHQKPCYPSLHMFRRRR